MLRITFSEHYKYRKTILNELQAHTSTEKHKKIECGAETTPTTSGNTTSNWAIKFLKAAPTILDYVISKTHGKPFFQAPKK